MKSFLIIFSLLISLSSFAHVTSEDSNQISSVTCNLRTIGKVDGADRPASSIIASVNEQLDLVKGTELKAVSNSGQTTFLVILKEHGISIHLMDGKMRKSISTTYLRVPIAITSEDIFVQVNGQYTPDGDIVLNCFGRKQ